MIDLHLHSHYSDGLQTAAELVDQAKQAGVTMLALTDHDMVRGLDEFVVAAQAAGITPIPGIEITTSRKQRTLHILAYNIDTTHQPLLDVLTHLREGRKRGVAQRLDGLNARWKAEGKRLIDTDDALGSMTHYALPTLMEYLLKHSFAATREAAYDLARGMNVHSDDVQTEDVIALVHDAGGLAVLAHAFAPKVSLRGPLTTQTELLEECRQLAQAGLDGLEVYTPAHPHEDVAFAESVAAELGLLATTGTDWHGPIDDKGASIKKFIPRYPDSYLNGLSELPTKADKQLRERLTLQHI